MSDKPERPSCCAECSRYMPDIFEKGLGACDNWGGVQIPPYAVCHPNFGRKKEARND